MPRMVNLSYDSYGLHGVLPILPYYGLWQSGMQHDHPTGAHQYMVLDIWLSIAQDTADQQLVKAGVGNQSSLQEQSTYVIVHRLNSTVLLAPRDAGEAVVCV